MQKGVVIVTGSAGRIGAKLIERLGAQYRIVGFELMKAIYASNNEELIPVDVSSDESVAQAFRHIKAFYGTHIVSVIHLAAYYSFEDQNYDKYRKITVEGTKRLLEALQEFTVEQFIFSSTMLVHKPSKKRINEYSPQKASWAYPRSKIETEAIIHKYRGPIPTVNLRIAGVYDDMCHSIPISNQIQRIHEKQLVSHFFPGNIHNGAAFLHMDDLIDAILLTVQKRRELPKETVLLLGEDSTLSTDQLQRKISRHLFGKEMKTIRIPKFLAWIGAFIQSHIPFMQKPFIRPWMIRFADDNYLLDISRAKKFLGWEPKHNVAKEIDLMLDRLLEDPIKWYKTNGLQVSPHFLRLWQRNKKKDQKAA